jgi:uncharacterized protein
MDEHHIQPSAAPPVTPSSNETQARTWNMWCHLSALAVLVGVPFGNVLGPLLVWQMKKNEFPSVEVHGKAALNFQLTVLIAAAVVFAAGFVLTFIVIGFFLIPVGILIVLCGVVFGIIAGIKANEGKDYQYPYSFEFVK